jgi:hypothetical protein
MSFCEFFIKILIKHPSKYKILRSKTVEEVSRTDELCFLFYYASRRKVQRHINLPMSTRSSVRLTSFTVFDLRILYFEGCLNVASGSELPIFLIAPLAFYIVHSMLPVALIFWTQKASYKHNVRHTILRSRSISAQSWVMLWNI